MSAFAGIIAGLFLYFLYRCLLSGFYTVQQNERAVITSFGRAARLEGHSTVELPIAEGLNDDERSRYSYPQLQVVGPGGPYLKLPWQRVHKVDVAIWTTSIAYDPEDPEANRGNTMLEAVTKDQLNIGITGQLRFKVSEQNLYAFLFGVKNPVAHVMGYFISILRERIANFEAKREVGEAAPVVAALTDVARVEGVSINDLRKNLNDINQQMDQECQSSSARYGIVLDSSLITGIDPPAEIESALAAINTAHNEVSAQVSLAQAEADQKIEQSKRAVEIQTMRAEAEVQPLVRLAEELDGLKKHGPTVLDAYLRSVRLGLLSRAKRVIAEVKP
jgi:regulator of protease activity HflC (stomatin/prohibitin superfamily)